VAIPCVGWVGAPTWLNLLGQDLSIPTFSGYPLWSHLAWGITLSVLTVAGYRYLTPRLVRLRDRPGDVRDRGETG